ncbi:MAG TPA: hypothetical protein PLI43_08990 [Albidovulum sp.]|uniref:hypothetical protein n=1 Tax=Albidovulum sp. TaxID=1872424 RepID=UPI002CD5A53A|nr:hypothetical protein [Albidovulum sp.]
MSEPSLPLLDRTPVGVRPGSLWLQGLSLGILLALALQVSVLIATAKAGGHEWIQGDWLINLAGGPVRRGAFGSAILAFSDITGLSPLDIVMAMQVTLVAALVLGTAVLLLSQPSASMSLAAMSPGIFALVWTIAPLAAGRKEIFGLLALLLLALPGGKAGRMVLSALLLAVGAVGHEVNVLIFPVWVVFLFLFPRPAGKATRMLLIAAVGVAVAGAAAFAISHARLASSEAVCAALTARGLDRSLLCNGAIAWLSHPGNGMESVAEALANVRNPGLLPLYWLCCALPLLRLWLAGKPPRLARLALAAGIGPIFLLYPVSLDWGRWVAIQTTVAALILLGLGARDRFQPVRPISLHERLLWLANTLAWTPHHAIGVAFGGLFALAI